MHLYVYFGPPNPVSYLDMDMDMEMDMDIDMKIYYVSIKVFFQSCIVFTLVTRIR